VASFSFFDAMVNIDTLELAPGEVGISHPD
jgi:hypothetical protein